MNKKGAGLNTLYPAVLTIVLIGIVLGVGIYVLTETSEAISTETLTVANETITTLNETGDAVATATDCGAHDFTGAVVTNVTSGATVPASNYTFSTAGVLVGDATSSYAGENVNISYSYTGTSNTGATGPCGSMDTTSTGIAGLASWIAVIVVVLAAAIVLGIVIGSFGRRSSV